MEDLEMQNPDNNNHKRTAHQLDESFPVLSLVSDSVWL
jgi:hypothetical protein